MSCCLIDRRGAGSTMGELISILRRRLDTGVRSHCAAPITDLRTTLQALGQEAVIIKRRLIAVWTFGQVDWVTITASCGQTGPRATCSGEYMSNYSWERPPWVALTGEDP